MILYQLSQWIDEIVYLKQSMQQTEGDTSFLNYKLEQAKGRVTEQTSQWMNPVISQEINGLAEESLTGTES